MKIEIEQKAFSAALTTAKPSLARGREVIPALACYRLTATDRGVTASTTNLETYAVVSIDGAVVKEPGEALLPGDVLVDLVRTMADTVHVSAAGLKATISSGRNKATVKGLDPADFPQAPTLDLDSALVVPGTALATAIRATAYAVARDDARPVLQGVRMARDGTTLTLASSDGFRVAEYVISDLAHAEAVQAAVVPARAVADLARMCSAQNVTIQFGRSGVVFGNDTVTLAARVVDAAFPSYRGIIPSSSQTTAMIDVAQARAALASVAVLARDDSYRTAMKVSDGALAFSSQAAERGNGNAAIEAKIDGPEVEVVLNCTYLAEALGSMPSERAVIGLGSPTTPVVIRPDGPDQAVAVIMPMHVGK